MKKILSLMIIGVFLVSAINIGAAPAEEEDIGSSAGGFELPCYGFIIPISDEDSYEAQIGICRLVNELLSEEITVYWSISDITLKTGILLHPGVGLRFLNRGSYLIPSSGDLSVDFNTIAILLKYSVNCNFDVYEIKESIENIEVLELVEPNIAYHGGTYSYNPDDNYFPSHSLPLDSIGWKKFHFSLESCGFKIGKVMDWDVIESELNSDSNNFNVFIWGGGQNGENAVEMQRYNTQAISEIKSFVNNGGGYIGACYGSYVTVNGINPIWDWIEPFCPDIPLGKFLSFSDTDVVPALPGTGEIHIKIQNNEIPVSFGLPEIFTSSIYGGPFFYDLDENTKSIATLEGVGNDFEPNQNVPEVIRDIWYDTSIGKTMWITTDVGMGKVVVFGDHPEYCEGSIHSERLIANSVFYSCAEGPFLVNIGNSIELSKLEIDADGPNEAYILDPTSFYGNNINWDPTIWHWDFGHDETSILQNPVHEFKLDTYTGYSVIKNVILLARDDNKNIGYDIHTITIKKKSIPNIPPEIPTCPYGFEAGKTDTTYYFSTYSSSPNGNPVSYSIDTGDGNIFEPEWPIYPGESFWWVYKWNEPGEYDIRIRSKEFNGDKYSDWSTVFTIDITEADNLNR